jgi:hypothetical protein
MTVMMSGCGTGNSGVVLTAGDRTLTYQDMSEATRQIATYLVGEDAGVTDVTVAESFVLGRAVADAAASTGDQAFDDAAALEVIKLIIESTNATRQGEGKSQLPTFDQWNHAVYEVMRFQALQYMAQSGYDVQSVATVAEGLLSSSDFVETNPRFGTFNFQSGFQPESFPWAIGRATAIEQMEAQ